ncbi:MAG: RNA polymerase-binding ATPase [Cycloclasticus sp. symbiont of Poecilosclerida sp. M]|nr:MAG: RNA polymerase-binding ATPase [Cycloclasticus sp. symbiont of Poecilosclerida sp. M]
MEQNVFQPGQRWISHFETELGLGSVEKIEGRQVTVFFPAVDDERVYALDNAPLSRVIYDVTDTIRNTEGDQMQVVQVQDHNGCVIYLCRDEQENEVVLHELDIDALGIFNKPQGRLFTGQVDKNKLFELRIATLDHQRKLDQFAYFGLSGPRVQVLPHQFYIADQVTKRQAPRVLLADEVGLGKTIEAGLILHQQLLTGSVERVLIVVPDALIHQWLVELLRRFNLSFTILDHERCDAIRAEGDINPFETAQLVLCQESFLTQQVEFHELASEARWDLLIVDEAHHLYWSEDHVSAEYQCVETLARQIKGLLLLTATPEQLGVASHFARLRLLDPDRYYDLKVFRGEQAGYQAVNGLIKQIMAADSMQELCDDEALKETLDERLGTDFLQAEDVSIDAVVSALLDRYGTGRVLYRNTRDTVEGFSDRQLHTYPLTVAENEDAGDVLDVQVSLHPELQAGDGWAEHDPRVKWLCDWLAEHKGKKVLLICALQKTAEQLHEFLKLKSVFKSAVFHEEMSLIERDRAAAYFAGDEEGAQILVCSEIGSEGRNFQFSHHLVLFDLPLNPDLLEQRIGRLDRIGQTDTVNLHVPFIENSPQHRLLRWFDEGLNAFSHVCSTGHFVYSSVKIELKPALVRLANDEAFEKLIAHTRQLAEASLQEMRDGRDLMLELNSCRKDEAQKIVDEVVLSSSHLELSKYMEQVFEQYGVEQQYHSEDCVVIKPTDHMQKERFPGLGEDGLTATYNRKVALSREDFHFLTWEHPMVVGAMDQIINSEFGNATFNTIKLSPVPAGTLILEAIYTVHCPAPRRLQLQRYLPHTVQRIVVGSNGLDMTKIAKAEHISARLTRVKKGVAQNIIQHGKESIKSLIERSEELVKPYQEALIEETVSTMQQQEDDKLNRLKAMAKVNPNIREDEIQLQQKMKEQLLTHLKRAVFKLDAIRVSLVSD